ncbi:TyeA family type III secretion system gatekeeper subunit [Burkholderia sp. Bp9126]|nr:TyeA family type III secretion system gatekeeper subunit [Burkholderia sp. Bp9126]
MLNQLDPSATRVTSATTSSAASSRALQAHAPAQSVYELAQNELSCASFDFSSAPIDVAGTTGGSLAETLEDIGFAVGTRVREARRGVADGRVERQRTRSMLKQLVKQINAASNEELAELRQRISAVDAFDDPSDAMRDAGLSAGEMVLLLASMLEEGRLSGKQFKCVEDSLATLLDSDEWALQMFARLELGPGGRASMMELRRLYQYATTRQKSLIQWFDEFRRLRDRTRKLKTLIRALAFELSAQNLTSNLHLATVITDLKRILQFLSLEDHCERTSRNLNIEGVDRETLMLMLIECVEHSWISADWLADRTQTLVRNDSARYRYAKGMMELAKLLSADCFNDTDQRDAILDAFANYLEILTNAGL